MFYKTLEHVQMTYSKMKLPNFAYRIPFLNPPLENNVWNLVRKDKDQSSFNREHTSLLGSLSTGLCMQLESRALCSGRPKCVLTVHPLRGRSLANEQEVRAMVHTLRGSQQVTASPRNFPSDEKASVFPHVCKRFLALLLHLLSLRFFFKKFR